ncbi:MAG: hypothetical protein ABIM89_09805 [Mycobacteriales bacterium]
MPGAGRRPVEREVGVAVTVVVGRGGDVVGGAVLHGRLTEDVPGAVARSIDRDVTPAVAVIVGGHRDVTAPVERDARGTAAAIPDAVRRPE